MLKTGLEWFRLLIVCLIAILAWQVSRGAETPVPGSKAERHLSTTMLNAHGGDGLMEDYGTNEPPDDDVSPVDCAQAVSRRLPPFAPDHVNFLVSCSIAPASGELGPAMLRRRRT